MIKVIEKQVLEKYGEVKPVKIVNKDAKKEMLALTFASMSSNVGLGPSRVEFYYAEKNNCILKVYQRTIDEIQVIEKKRKFTCNRKKYFYNFIESTIV